MLNRSAHVLYKTRFATCLVLRRVSGRVRRSLELRTAIFTVVLAAATVGLGVAAIVQHADTVKAIEATNRLAQAAEASAEQNKRLAAAAELSANTAEETLGTTRENFRSIERPYVWLTNNQSPPELESNGQVVWTWYYTNYGKSPALDIQFEHFIKLGNRQWASSFSSRGPTPGAPLPPNAADRAAVVSPPEIDQEELNRLWATDAGIKIAGKITYSDAYKGDHETTFCLAKLLSGAILHCNDRDGNSLK